MIDVIIFSKNRPMQLECLLRSIEDNATIFNNIYVQYYSDEKYLDGYIQLMDLHPKCYYINETKNGFKETFKNILSISHSERICFMVDDDILFGKIDEIEDCDIFSLRLGNNIKNKIHHEYTGSVDGNIFKRNIVLELKNRIFTNPNQLEVELLKITKGYKMKHFEESKLIGIPHNKVSDTSKCYDMNGSLDRLNGLFLDGWCIDYKKMDLKHNDVHKNVSYEIVKFEFTDTIITKN